MYSILSSLVMVKGMDAAEAEAFVRTNFDALNTGCPAWRRNSCAITKLPCSCENCPYLKSN